MRHSGVCVCVCVHASVWVRVCTSTGLCGSVVKKFRPQTVTALMVIIIKTVACSHPYTPYMQTHTNGGWGSGGCDVWIEQWILKKNNPLKCQLPTAALFFRLSLALAPSLSSSHLIGVELECSHARLGQIPKHAHREGTRVRVEVWRGGC